MASKSLRMDTLFDEPTATAISESSALTQLVIASIQIV